MRGLFVKDLEFVMQQKMYFMFLIIISVVLNFTTNNTNFAVYYLTVVSAFFVSSTISYDESDNGFCFLMTLPIRRKDYVKEKYLFGSLLIFISGAIGVLIEIISGQISGMELSLLEIIADSIMLVPVGLLFIAFMMPFIIKYGHEHGRFIALGAIGVVCLAIYLANKILKSMDLNILNILNSFSNFNILLIASGVCLAAILIYFISYMVSVAFMKKREF